MQTPQQLDEFFRLAISHSLTEKEEPHWRSGLEVESGNPWKRETYTFRVRVQDRGHLYGLDTVRDIDDIGRWPGGAVDYVCMIADMMATEIREAIRKKVRCAAGPTQPFHALRPLRDVQPAASAPSGAAIAAASAGGAALAS